MKNIQSIQLIEGSNEELLPGFSPDFPYIASRALLDRYLEPATPWHWHRTVELFYMESGTLEYSMPVFRSSAIKYAPSRAYPSVSSLYTSM